MKFGGYEISILVQGFPGKTVCHGGLGWSTIALLRGHGRVALIDCGSIGVRKFLMQQLATHGLKPADVTDVILTHAHYDHILNWTMFSHARITIGEAELAWALKQPWGQTAVPELYVRELERWPTAARLVEGSEALPGLKTYMAPGHTPGHLIFVLKGEEYDVIFTGDAVKNRAEFLCGRVDMTLDAAASSKSVNEVWNHWRSRPGNIVIPGHDLPMHLVDGRPQYIGQRNATVEAWFGDDIETTTAFDLKVEADPQS